MISNKIIANAMVQYSNAYVSTVLLAVYLSTAFPMSWHPIHSEWRSLCLAIIVENVSCISTQQVYSKFDITLVLKVILISIQNRLTTCLQLSNNLAVNIRKTWAQRSLWVPVTCLLHLRTISLEGSCRENGRGVNLFVQCLKSKVDGTLSPNLNVLLYLWPLAPHDFWHCHREIIGTWTKWKQKILITMEVRKH